MHRIVNNISFLIYRECCMSFARPFLNAASSQSSCHTIEQLVWLFQENTKETINHFKTFACVAYEP